MVSPHGMKGFVTLTPDLEQRMGKLMNAEDVTPARLNLVRGAIAAHEHAFHFPELTKEAFLKFMGVAWDAGEHQRKVFGMKVDGSFNNETGVALTFASYVALFGEREGLIPKEAVPA